MSEKAITAHVRNELGKGPARRLRADGKIPAVLYGGGVNPVSLALDPLALLKTLDPELKRNTLLRLEVEGRPELSTEVMVKDAQVDTLRNEILHVDLIRVTTDSLVDVRIPLVLKGRAEGVRLGGVLQQVLRDIPIRCKASEIPAKIELDTTHWKLHHQLRAEDLPLPEGVEVRLPPRQKIATISAGRGAQEEEEGAKGADEESAADQAASAAE